MSICPDCRTPIPEPSGTRPGGVDYRCPGCDLTHTVQADGIYIYAASEADVAALLAASEGVMPWFGPA